MHKLNKINKNITNEKSRIEIRKYSCKKDIELENGNLAPQLRKSLFFNQKNSLILYRTENKLNC